MQLNPRDAVASAAPAFGRGHLLVALALLAGIATGVFVAAVTPLYAFAALIGLLAGAALFSNTQLGLLAFVGVVSLLPFGVVPLALGFFKLTFLDFILVILLVLWLGRALLDVDARLRGGSVAGAVLVFIVLALVSFAAGTAYTITAETTRLFLKIVNSVLFYFTVVNCVRNPAQLRRLMAAFIVAGAVAAVAGLVLYFLPAANSSQLLSALRPLGYPSGDVLRYIADTDVQRAIGTAIDPNILGALLMVVATLAATQAVSPQPVLDRRVILGLLVPIIACLLLTYSRSSWMGLAAGVMFVGSLRYRRLWLAFVAIAVALYFGLLPQGEGFVGHLQSGLAARDQAAAMRLGEYRDALRLITQYPWFGVGFGSAPTIDLYVGVSNIYLLIAEEMGLVGLAAFLITIVILFWRCLRALPLLSDPCRQGMLLSALAAVVGALVAGMFDHHFFNLRFPHTVAVFWFIVGLAVIAANHKLGEPDNTSAIESSSR